MFYIIYIAVIVFALYVIFNDRHEDGGKPRRSSERLDYHPEQPGPIPQEPVSPTPKPLEPAPPVKAVAARPAAPTVSKRNVSERALSWSYLYSLEFDERLVSQTMRTDITGMRYYCSFADVGLVNGFVQPEPSNPHDPRAQVVIRADGKKLGYIPRYALDEYVNFSGGFLVCPFAGRVTVDNKGNMRADILVARPTSREFVKEKLSDFLERQ